MQIGALTSTLQTFLDSWKAACHGDIVPKRTAIRPDIFPRQSLSYITYQEYEAPGVLVWKIAGTALVDAIGMELAGTNAFELLPAEGRQYDVMAVEAALAHPCGMTYVLATLSAHGEPTLNRLLQLPVRGDDGTIKRFVGMAEPYTPPGNSSTIDMKDQTVVRCEGGLIDIGFGLPNMDQALSGWNKTDVMV